MTDAPHPPAPPSRFMASDRGFRRAVRVVGLLTLVGGVLGTKRFFGIPVLGAPAPDDAALSFLIEAGALVIVLAAPLLARKKVAVMGVTESGVTGPGFLKPVFIPWSDVVLVCEDKYGILVQSATRSARISLYDATYRWSIGGVRGVIPVWNFDDPQAVVRFILAHVPKHAMVELSRWKPT